MERLQEDCDSRRCEVCNCRVSSAGEMKLHINGKKHAMQILAKQERERHQRQSVFVRNFSDGIAESDLQSVLSPFGAISKILLDKSSEKPKYAIVEFSTEEAAQTLLKLPEPLLLNGKRLVIKPRTMPERHSSTADIIGQKRGSASSPTSVKSPKQKGARHEEQSKKNRESLSMDEDDDTSMLLSALADVRTFDEQFSAVVSQQCLADADVALRQRLADQLCAALTEHAYPSVAPISVQLYGSAVNGFGTKRSDVDLCLLTGRMQPQESKAEEMVLSDSLAQSKLVSPASSITSLSTVGDVSMDDSMTATADDAAERHRLVESELKTVVAVVRQHVPNCTRVYCIARARRPVVRFYHTELQVSCDLTLNNRLAVENTKLLQCYSRLDHRVRPLVYAVRAWARGHALGGSSVSLLSGYSLALMTIAFLQRCDPPVLPCLQREDLFSRRASGEADGCIEGWDCSFDQSPFSSVNFQSCGELLHGFFVHYSTFSFDSNAVTVSRLSPVTISEVSALANSLQAEAGPSKEDAPCHRPFRQSSISVLDPFELTHNVSGSVGPMLGRKFVDECRSAVVLCETRNLEEHVASSADSSPGQETCWGLALLLRPAVQSQRLLSFQLPTAHFDLLSSAADSAAMINVDLMVLRLLCKQLESDYGFQTLVEDSFAQSKSSRGMADQGILPVQDCIERPGEKRRSDEEALPRAKRSRGESHSDIFSSSQRAQCTAMANSWLHRRRWRRAQQRLAKDNESGGVEMVVDAGKPVLEFFLHAACSDGHCSVTFEPTPTTDMKVLHGFVCVFKKDVLMHEKLH